MRGDFDEDELDDGFEDYDLYASDGCQTCGGEGFIVVCVDDMCRGCGECMHGDGEAPCPDCGGIHFGAQREADRRMKDTPFLRPARPGDIQDATARSQLVARARSKRAEIQQMFRDVAFWNENARKPHEAPIDPDPEGTMVCLLAYLDHVLAGEPPGVSGVPQAPEQKK